MRITTVSALGIGILIGALGMCLLTQERFGNADCPGEPGIPCGNGDVNGDGSVDLADAVYILQYLFGGGPEIVPLSQVSQHRLPATGQTDCYDTWANAPGLAWYGWWHQ